MECAEESRGFDGTERFVSKFLIAFGTAEQTLESVSSGLGRFLGLVHFWYAQISQLSQSSCETNVAIGSSLGGLPHPDLFDFAALYLKNPEE